MCVYVLHKGNFTLWRQRNEQKSVLWLIKPISFFFFFDVLVAVAVVVAKAHSTRIRIFLNPQIFLCGFKNYLVHT